MSMLESAIKIAQDAAVTFGKAALHVAAPDNFEYYMCSLELLDSEGNTLGFMSFAVMPNNIVESKVQINTITKTNKGVVSLFNPTFVPRDISIQGTFGRKFRMLLGMKEPGDVSGVTFFNGNMGFDALGEDVLIKTGYGLTKMLKSMIDNSFKLVDGKPCILVFNNYALNTHYVVEPIQSSFTQSVENNMLWYYSLEMKAIAPADVVKTTKDRNKDFFKKVAVGKIAKGVNTLVSDALRMIKM